MNPSLSLSRLRQLTEEPDRLRAERMIDWARLAIRCGRRLEARRWLWAALEAQPDNVTAWLILAVLASPRASLSYVIRALELRPSDPIAHRALRWARRRVGTMEGA